LTGADFAMLHKLYTSKGEQILSTIAEFPEIATEIKEGTSCLSLLSPFLHLSLYLSPFLLLSLLLSIYLSLFISIPLFPISLSPSLPYHSFPLYFATEFDKLRSFRHIDNWLEKKYQNDQPALLTVTVEVEDQTYEATVDSTALFLQPLVTKLLQKVRKNEEKNIKKKGKDDEVRDAAIIMKERKKEEEEMDKKNR
jgi:hypothetical protein